MRVQRRIVPFQLRILFQKLRAHATRQKTNDAEGWIDLGTAYRLENNWPQARAALEAALRLNPTNRLALLHLHELQEKLDQPRR